MIKVEKLDGQNILLNPDNINFIEEKPDTLVHFKDGSSLYVKTTLEELREKVNGYKKDIFSSFMLTTKNMK